MSYGEFITRYIAVGIIIFLFVFIFAELEIIWGSHEWAMLLFAFGPCYLVVGFIAVVTYGIKFVLSRLRKK